MASHAEIAAMRRAVVLAQTPGVPLGPNPRVGAVVINRDGDVVAEGFHRGAGTPHAEVDALENAGGAARGATAVVTLEPCNHTGRTGPCSAALVDAGIERVVYAQPDNTPRAQGGAQHLREAGLEVESGVLLDEARQVNRAWSFAAENQRPFVTWKFAATLDGRSAAADGTSRWITGDDARRDVHRLRGECDAVLVGTGTVTADNPQLNVRDERGVPLPVDRQPLRAVMGCRDLSDDAAVFDGSAPTIRLRTHDPRLALEELFARDRQHVWLEGGPSLAAHFLAAGLVDEVVAYVAPALLGAGASAVGDLGIHTMTAALRLRLVDVARIGDDVRITLKGTS
jgi:diaminohydroxyphosphoribosylaminopyrimidine deaminase/5-amino-6-(5-phosphoribosylamino)uracil reductase